MKVLIVDDDHMSCQCLQQLIDWASIGCEQPLCAFNGAEALKLIEARHPDIVVSDVKMPVMDGRELCRQIYEKYPDINLFFVSAYGDFETAQLAIRYQVKGYVLKPLDADALRTLQDMICKTAVRQESTSFFIKICGDEYRDVLKCAIEEKDREMVERFLDRVERLQDNLSLEDIGLWQHLIAPLIDYRKTCLKMDYGLLLQTERRLQEEIMDCPVPERTAWLRGQFAQAMQQEKPNSSLVIGEMQKAIQEQFSSPDLDINMLAWELSMSPVYLGRLFLEQTGMKVTDYIQEKRLRFACEQLQHSVSPVKEIARLSGYRDAGYFNKVFRRNMNMTPGEYREKYWHRNG